MRMLVLPGNERLEVFRSEAGYICIRQVGEFRDGNSPVMLLPNQVASVIEELKRLASEAGPDNDLSHHEDPGQKPTHA